MSKHLIIAVDYDSLTRQLVTNITMEGFIETLPDTPIISLQTDTLTLFKGVAMTAVDQDYVIKSIARALLSANVQLGQWAAASANQALTDQLLASTINPVEVFDETLKPPTEETP